MTDDVIYSTQYYIKYINRAISVNLQENPLKLGRLIVLQETHLLVIFSLKTLNEARRPVRANIFTCLLDRAYETPLANIKMDCQRWPEKPLILGRSGTQYVAMVTKLLCSYCGAHLVESYCKESNVSDKNWLRYLSSSYLIKIWLCMTSSFG